MKTNLAILLAIKATVALAIILLAGIGLGPDEAQYWTWSQQLDWGYYSKPPGIAWQIAAGTWLFGNTELGVRIGAVTLSLLLVWATYRLSLQAGTTERTAFWSACVMAFSPLGFLSSLFAITDTGFILFWTLALGATAQALKEDKELPFLLIGFWILCGAFFKWPIYLLWLFVPFFSRRWVSSKLLGGIALSLLGLLPSLIWNAQHEWATFRHVFSTVFHGAVEPGTNLSLYQGNAGNFFGAQVALLSPLFLLLYLAALGYLLCRWTTIPRPLRFCGVVSGLLFAAFVLLSFQKKMQGNWGIYAYPSGMVFLCWVFCERLFRKQLILVSGLAVSIALTAFVLVIPKLEETNAALHIPFAKNPFKHNLGWRVLGKILSQYSTDYLIGDRYQMASELSFYGPNQQRAYFMNLHGLRKNQFSFWPSPLEEQKGKTGLFIVVENEPHIQQMLIEKTEEYRSLLLPYFEKVEIIGRFPLFFSYGKEAKAALIIRCEGVTDDLPDDPNKY